MIQVFANCTSCGPSGLKIMRMLRWAKENKVDMTVNTIGRVHSDKKANELHGIYLQTAGLSYQDIVVDEDGKVTPLLSWKSPQS